MVHPDTELRRVSDTIGWGVFATKPIPRGTITWALDPLDQRFAPAEVAALPGFARNVLRTYAYNDADGQSILCWDHARFFNHHCEANCLGVGYDFEVAVRDIAEGEELTDDYGTLYLDEPFPCRCGSPVCRLEALPDDLLRHGARWHALASAAFFQIPAVSQPLWEIVPDRALITAALADPSVLRPLHPRKARFASAA